MAEKTAIQWCNRRDALLQTTIAGHTFNPWIGCTPAISSGCTSAGATGSLTVSPACVNCYARTLSKRMGRASAWGPQGVRQQTSAAYRARPFKWDAAAKAAGHRAIVFCASMADWAEDHPSIQPQWREELFQTIRATPHLDWLLLSKRADNIARFLPSNWGQGWDNVWLGTTTEDRQRAEERIPALLAVPAKVHFISAEPLLGAIDLAPWLSGQSTRHTLDWVAYGGESGGKARPTHPEWLRGLRDQCLSAGIPSLLKQWGEWVPKVDAAKGHEGKMSAVVDDSVHGPVEMLRVGKKAAGKRLDGVEHLAWPA